MGLVEMNESEVPEIGRAEIEVLLRFLPIFSDPEFKAGEWVVREGQFPYFQPVPELDGFVQTVYREGIILQFDWGTWMEEARRYIENSNAVGGADLLTLRKLLTAHVRGDRFNEGYLASLVEKGHIVAILQRLETLRDSM